MLRVAIEGGGCSGFQYGLGFDRGAQEGDHAFECEGVTVVVDPFSAPYLMGAPGRLPRDDQESGFKIDNPNAVASCGCGHSFQVAEGEAPEDAAAGCGSAARINYRPLASPHARRRRRIGPGRLLRRRRAAVRRSPAEVDMIERLPTP